MTQRDPGLARERTELSWRRTSLSIVVAAAIVIRTAESLVARTGVGLTLGAAALVALHAASSRSGPSRRRHLGVLAAATAAAGLFGVVEALGA